jgi:hydroxymethylpyrimidine/phosphomethylpyrimidine kinase
MPARPPIVLTIGGSDPTAGAGVQGDLRTIDRLGGYGVCAITSVTVQDTCGLSTRRDVAAELLAAQVAALAGDLPIAVVKAGMLGSSANVEAVARFLDAHPKLPFVLDPVLAATAGGPLLDANATATLIAELLPRATLVTPNLPEAVLLAGRPETDDLAAEPLARTLCEAGARAVLLTGGHRPGGDVVDLLFDGTTVHRLTTPRLAVAAHGTGCALTAAIATRLAFGDALLAAVEAARDHLLTRLRGALHLGHGQRLLP